MIPSCKKQIGVIGMTDPGAASYEKYLNGDDRGMTELIIRYRDGLILYLNSFTGNIHEAEELAMDTFVKLGVRRPKNKSKAGFKTWLYTIARNLTIDYLRKQEKRKEVPLDEMIAVQDDEACLERLYIKQENKIAVHRAMRELPINYRQVLWLIYFEGFTTRQTAEVLRKTAHNVEVLVSRARKALRKQLEKEGFIYENI